jgi:hypothetical protein
MVTLSITKEQIVQEICGTLCGMAESSQDRTFELSDTFVFIKDWNNGKPLMVSYKTILQGYHAYGTDKVPAFISSDWPRAIRIYKKLKGL